MSEQLYDIFITLKNIAGKDIAINSEYILSLSVTESVLSILPKFDMMISDVGLLTESNPITDKSYFRIVVKDIATETPLVDADFMISTFFMSSDTFDNKYSVMNIAGYMYGKHITSPEYNTYMNGSSDDVIRKVCNNVGINFNRKVRGNDSITWLQTGSNLSFMNHITERSFIDGDGVFVYGSVDGSITYTSYTKEMMKANSKIAKYDKNKTERSTSDLTPQEYVYFSAYNYMNNVENYNDTFLYGGKCNIYNLTEYRSTTIKQKKFKTNFLNQNKKFKESSYSYDAGIISDPNMNTMYKGKVQNDFFKYSMFSNTVVLNINSGVDVKLFDKLDFMMPSFIDDLVSDPLSGGYVVGSKTYSVKRGRPLEVSIMLCRNGLNDSTTKTFMKEIE